MEKANKIFLILLILIIVILHFIFLKKDNFPPIHDEFRSFFYSIGLIDDLKKPRMFFNEILIRGIPPFYELTALPFLIFDKSSDAMAISNILWLILLIVSIYLLTKKLINSFYGILSVIIIIGFPAIIGFSRVCYYPIALAAIVSVSYYYLINSNFFKNKKYTYLWASTYIIGLLIHPYFFLYTFPSVILTIFNMKDKIQVVNFIKACLLIIITSGLWYFSALAYPPSRAMVFKLLKPSFASYKDQFSIFDKIRLYFFPHSVLYSQICIYYYFLILSSFYLFLKIPTIKNKIVYYIFFWIFISSFLILLHPTVANPKLIIPILPGIGILITYFISKLAKIIKTPSPVIFIIISLLSFFSHVELKNTMINNPRGLYLCSGRVFALPEIKGMNKILDSIKKQPKPLVVGFIPENLYDPNPFISEAIMYECRREEIENVNFFNLANIIDGKFTYSKFIDISDFIFYIKSEGKSDFPGYKGKQLLALQNEFKKRLDEFVYLKKVDTDYGSIKIFKHIK